MFLTNGYSMTQVSEAAVQLHRGTGTTGSQSVCWNLSSLRVIQNSIAFLNLGIQPFWGS
jgi:hypothetical protein